MAERTVSLKLQMSVCDSIRQVFEGNEPHDHFWLCAAHLAGRFQHWRLWQVPVDDFMHTRRVPWALMKTERCSDGVYCHLLRDLSSTQ